MTLTVEAVLALAPDDSSAKAARGLISPAKWPLLGANEAAAWGECQGSGSKPYQTQVDLSGPAFRCTCPSRKFPCKHGLALMLMRAQNAELFKSPEAPTWVSEWLASRAEKAEKKEQRAVEKAAAPVDPEAAAKREQQRWKRIAEASQELQRWLADQVSRGLGALNAEALQGWHTMAARMVDAQAPGLGQRVRDAASMVGQGADWPERVLHQLGLLHLGCEALSRRESLDARVQADLRAIVVGWPHDKAEVLAEGQRVADRWTVLGVAIEDRDDKLTERRVWLHGQASRRRSWLLDHAFGGRGFEQSWIAGTTVETALTFFPGASALRALSGEPGVVVPETTWPAAALDEEWRGVAARVSACPWVSLHPLVMTNAVVQRIGPSLAAVAGGQALPLSIGLEDSWSLLAQTGGHAFDVMGEWDGRSLRILSAWNDGGLVWQRSAS